MSQERKTYPKEFKLMIVERSNKRTDLADLANELDINPSLLYGCNKEFSELNNFSSGIIEVLGLLT